MGDQGFCYSFICSLLDIISKILEQYCLSQITQSVGSFKFLSSICPIFPPTLHHPLCIVPSVCIIICSIPAEHFQSNQEFCLVETNCWADKVLRLLSLSIKTIDPR